MTRALVLGGGGVTGIAWEAGVLAALGERGLDLDGFDVVLGTSAGAIVAAQLAGADLGAFFRQQASPDFIAEDEQLRLLAGRFGGWSFVVGRRHRLAWLPRLWALSVVARGLAIRMLRRRLRRSGVSARTMAPSPHARSGANTALARIGAFARACPTASEARWLEVIAAALLPVTAWTDRLLVTAIDAHDGSLVAFDAQSGVPLVLAVAASAAVPGIFPPVRIDGRSYIDGGMASDANVHLAAGHREVLVVAPLDRGLIEGEVAALERAGTRVTIVSPSPDAARSIGTDLALLDPARRREAALAGYQDGLAAARRLVASSAA